MISHRLLSLLNALPVTWLALALPSVAFVQELFVNERYFAELMYETGVLSVQLLVVALALTPLLHLCRQWPQAIGTIRWFIKRRRAMGVASFGYAVLHLLFYVREVGGWELAYLNAFEWELLSGWLALFVLLVLAATSNNISQRWLGARWKTLQRATYIGAALTALHWLAFDQFLEDLWLWSLPLIALQIWRIFKHRNLRQPKLSSHP